MQTPEERVRRSLARQGALCHIGVELVAATDGDVTLALPFGPNVTQQHGFFHGGVITMLLDSACGYAALFGMATDRAVLTAEFKVNFLAPASGPRLLAHGRVRKAGRTLHVCQGVALAGEREVAIMQATMMAVPLRPGLED